MSLRREVSDYKGHKIELISVENRTFALHKKAKPSLLIDGRSIEYGQFPDGKYGLYQYAYNPTSDLSELAKKYIDYQEENSH